MSDPSPAEHVARLFHETHERLAGGPVTPWEQVPDSDRRLLVATVEAVVGDLSMIVEGDGWRKAIETLRAEGRRRDGEEVGPAGTWASYIIAADLLESLAPSKLPAPPEAGSNDTGGATGAPR